IGAGAAPLRIDFLSAFTLIDIAQLTVAAGNRPLYAAARPDQFDTIRVAGDAERIGHPSYLRLQITGVDPQLYLPPITHVPDNEPLTVTLRLRVATDRQPGQ
ncbi:MAG TPA: hypothetical protein VK993_12420, partial [Chthoniobacterales bacterium]|nr:hypothetical protein [Chthoniobacterales bacterium]